MSGADLETSPESIGAVVDRLRAAGGPLARRPSREIVAALGRVGVRFLDPEDPVRAEALRLLPDRSGLSPEMCAAVLDGMAADWTEERLLGLVRAELGDERVLDGFVPSRGGDATGGSGALAVGPKLCVQIVAGGVPGVGVSALLRSLLLKGPTLLKPGRGDVVLPELFARALGESDPELAEALAVVYWPGGRRELEDAALARADVVVVYGSDDTVADVRARVPATARFVGYHHRVSVGVVGREALTGERVDTTAAEVAEAVALFDRRGCVSPQIVFVEEGGAVAPAAFASVVGDAFRDLEERLPTGALDEAEASALHQLRGTAELVTARGEGTVIHGGAAPWTVILEGGEASLGSCAGRTVGLRPVADASAVADLVAPLGPHLQTVGVAGLEGRLKAVAEALGRVGASRVVPFARVAFPPPWWHHDGRGPLLDLTRWVDLEGE